MRLGQATRRLLPILALVVAAGWSASLSADAAPGASREQPLPTHHQWLEQVRHRLVGSRAFVGRRVATATGPLALNLDIDNTSLQTHYRPGRPVRPVLRLARYAARHGVAVLFNTGRTGAAARAAEAELTAAGFPVTEVCHRRPGEPVVVGKQRCRAQFVAEGYRIIANVGNHRTDFTGGDYDRRYRLPGYHGRLG